MKSGRSASATPDSGSRLAASASTERSDDEPRRDRPQDLLGPGGRKMRDVRQRHHGLPLRLPLPAFFVASDSAGSSGRGGARRGLRRDEQMLAAVDAGERRAGDAREDLTGFALERRDARHGEAWRIGAVEPRGHQHVADLDVRARRHEAQLGRAPGARAIEHRAHAAALDLHGHRVVLVGDQRHLRHVGIHARDLPDDAVGIDHGLAGPDVGIGALVDEQLLRERVTAGVEDLDGGGRRRVARPGIEQRPQAARFPAAAAANACAAAALLGRLSLQLALSSVSARCDVK